MTLSIHSEGGEFQVRDGEDTSADGKKVGKAFKTRLEAAGKIRALEDAQRHEARVAAARELLAGE